MKYGNPLPGVSLADAERFWSFVDKGESCWEWQGRKNRGYGRFTIDGVQHSAHRVAWVATHGHEPSSEVLDHLCGNPSCVRPDHLEEVTQSENCRRGANGYANRELCRAGLHQITDPEDVIEGANGRQCAECSRESKRRYDAQRLQDPEFRARKAKYLRELRKRRRKAGPWLPVEGESRP